MIHLTLPMRPRGGDSSLPYLTTPLSVFDQIGERRTLCITGIKSLNWHQQKIDYLDILKKVLGSFDSVYTDCDKSFLSFIQQQVSNLPVESQWSLVNSCECGNYEESIHARSFNLTRVSEGKCTNCFSLIKPKLKQVLLFNLSWETVLFSGIFPNWVEKDYLHFRQRQPVSYLFSKDSEVVRIFFDNVTYGIRYQFLWALLLVYVSEMESDNCLTLHYVNKVQDKAFHVASIAKMIRPSIQIHLRALPVVWPQFSSDIKSCTQENLDRLRLGLISKRKEIKV